MRVEFHRRLMHRVQDPEALHQLQQPVARLEREPRDARARAASFELGERPWTLRSRI